MPRHIVQIQVNIPHNFQVGRNNNDEDRYALARNQLYRIAFLRFTLMYARIFSDKHRKVFEFTVLLLALFSFITLIYIHIVFAQSPITCLKNYENEWKTAKILRVELLHRNENNNYSIYDSYYKEHAKKLQESGLKPCPRIQQLQTVEHEFNKSKTDEVHPFKEESLDMAELLRCNLKETTEEKTLFENIFGEIGSALNLQPNEEINIIEYSFEYGFLRLSPAMRNSLNLSVLFVVIDPNEDACVGGMFHKFILDQILGYDELLISSVRYLAEKSQYKGFVRNVAKEIEFIFVLNNDWLHSYAIAAIIMPLTTFSVSLLLRFAHQQMFVVCTNIFEIVRMHHQGRYNGSPLLTVVLALFGMMAIITSFFHNSTLTLNIIFIVWLADFYDSVCCRSAMSKRHWYRFFLLYHYVFYAYNNRFNGLFWQLNLLTSWLFILHSMLFFFHHYELPHCIMSFVEFRETHTVRRRDPRQTLRTSQTAAVPSQAESQDVTSDHRPTDSSNQNPLNNESFFTETRTENQEEVFRQRETEIIAPDSIDASVQSTVSHTISSKSSQACNRLENAEETEHKAHLELDEKPSEMSDKNKFKTQTPENSKKPKVSLSGSSKTGVPVEENSLLTESHESYLGNQGCHLPSVSSDSNHRSINENSSNDDALSNNRVL